MTIALIANDSKKDLMVDFCNAYCGILRNHRLIATASTGNVIQAATGLKIDSVLAGKLGGTQQVGRLITCGEVDVVLMFNDYIRDAHNADNEYLMGVCDKYTVPVATNIASAELMVRGIARGDMDWKEQLKK